MRCISTSPDWGLIIAFALFAFGLGLAIGKTWSEWPRRPL